MKRLARRRWIFGMLIAALLSAQSPWTHAARMQRTGTASTAVMAQATAEELPCHGHHAASTSADNTTVHPSPDAAGCCAGDGCDGHCMHLTWLPASPSLQPGAAQAALLAPPGAAVPLQQRLPEFFRPPI